MLFSSSPFLFPLTLQARGRVELVIGVVVVQEKLDLIERLV